MIKFALKCDCKAEFESWFPSGDSYERQARDGLIECPRCGSHKVEKAPMAPAVVARAEVSRAGMREAMRAIRRHVEANTKDVGADFPQAARDMHAGLTPEAPIRGIASPREAKALLEEGVPVMPLPPAPEDAN